MKRVLSLAGALAVAVGIGGCGSETRPTSLDDTSSVMFVVDVAGERFNVRVSDASAIAAIRLRLQTGQRGVIIGRLASGSGGFNTPWSWHLDPATVQSADLAAEVCDGKPSDVEGNLGYWLGTVRNYCPWGAAVVGES